MCSPSVITLSLVRIAACLILSTVCLTEKASTRNASAKYRCSRNNVSNMIDARCSLHDKHVLTDLLGIEVGDVDPVYCVWVKHQGRAGASLAQVNRGSGARLLLDPLGVGVDGGVVDFDLADCWEVYWSKRLRG